jgi:hypothetical protein
VLRGVLTFRVTRSLQIDGRYFKPIFGGSVHKVQLMLASLANYLASRNLKLLPSSTMYLQPTPTAPRAGKMAEDEGVQ